MVALELRGSWQGWISLDGLMTAWGEEQILSWKNPTLFFQLLFSVYLEAWSIVVKCHLKGAQKEAQLNKGERYRVKKKGSELLHWLCIKIQTGSRKKLGLLIRFFLTESRVCVTESHLNVKLAQKFPTSFSPLRPHLRVLISSGELAIWYSRGHLENWWFQQLCSSVPNTTGKQCDFLCKAAYDPYHDAHSLVGWRKSISRVLVKGFVNRSCGKLQRNRCSYWSSAAGAWSTALPLNLLGVCKPLYEGLSNVSKTLEIN